MTCKSGSWLKTVAVVGSIVIGILVPISFFGDSDTRTNTQNSQAVTLGDADRRITSTKAELNNNVAQNQDGKTGKNTLRGALKPANILPPVLALVENELKYYGINRTELEEQIKSDPDKFWIAVPEHWRKRFLILTPAHEKLVGDKLDADLAAKGKIYQNDEEMKRVRKIAEKIAAQLPEKPPIRLFLIRDDTINAFCLPNGSIYIQSGMLKNIKNDDELAFVIAHEYAHYAARHGNETLSKFFFLMAGNTLAKKKADQLKKEGKAGKGLLLRGAYLGGGIVGAFLPFSRKMENEADTLGIRYMTRAGYDPQGAVLCTQRFASMNPNDPL